MKIVCWQKILMKYLTLFFSNLRMMSQNLSSAAVLIGTLKVKFSKKLFQEHYQSVKQLGSDLSPNCLQRLSADDKSGG